MRGVRHSDETPAPVSNGDRDADSSDADPSDADPSDVSNGAVDSPDGKGDAGADAPVRRAFVSSFVVKGSEVGTACAVAATNAGLSGTFIGWLSYSDAGAEQRVGPGPYYLVGAPATLATSDPAMGLAHAIDRTESGLSLSGNLEVWTGTDDLGQPAALGNCDDWQRADGTVGAQFGDWSQSDKHWTYDHGGVCSDTHVAHVYCFEAP